MISSTALPSLLLMAVVAPKLFDTSRRLSSKSIMMISVSSAARPIGPAPTIAMVEPMLSDILPTGFECGVLNGKVQPDEFDDETVSRSWRAINDATSA
jgi:hypothetical protein